MTMTCEYDKAENQGDIRMVSQVQCHEEVGQDQRNIERH